MIIRMEVPSQRTPSAVASYLTTVVEAAAGTPYIGEPMSQTEHALQCGALAISALGFPEKVARLVESHVTSKRFLCAADPGYYRRLRAKRASRTKKGGGGQWPVSRRCRSSERRRGARTCAGWDDEAKVLNLQVPGMGVWRERSWRGSWGAGADHG